MPANGPIYHSNRRALQEHPPEVIDAIRNGNIKMWTPFRTPHMFKADGTPCSKDKDPCLIITKYQGRYAYLCHRCGIAGYVHDKDVNTPGDAMRLLANFKGKEKPEVLKLSDIKKIARHGRRIYPDSNTNDLDHLPEDFKLLSSRNVPSDAKSWMVQHKLHVGMWIDHKIGYSKRWDRIIFPIFNYIRNLDDNILDKRLVGWTGRCYRELSKEERQAQHRPKWVTQKASGEYERIFFTAPREHGFSIHTPVVYVEDAISAIRVQSTMSHETVALLNTHLPYSLVCNYKDNIQILWLDPDMRKKTIKTVARYKSLGFKMGYIFSDIDPKGLAQHEIRYKVNNAVLDISQQRDLFTG